MSISQRLQRMELATIEGESAAFGAWADTLTPGETRAFVNFAIPGLIKAGHLPPLSTPGDVYTLPEAERGQLAALMGGGPVPTTAQNIAAHQELIRLWQTYQQRPMKINARN